MNNRNLICTVVGLLFLAAGLAAMPPADDTPPSDNKDSHIVDLATWIDANQVLMFVTNVGSFAYDNGVFLGKADGLYYPYESIGDILNGSLVNTVVYSAGVWIGGRVDGEVRVALSGYENEYGPGPMEDGTFLPDDPSFKVYKLYEDSLAANPNDDFLNWPVDQGAPVDLQGRPHCYGDQMLWTVFNDANPARHNWYLGSTEPLGIEVQLTVWAMSQGAEGTSVYMKYKFYNKGGNTIEDCHITLWVDPDLGDAGDDLVGCDTLNDLFFCYNGDGYDAVYGNIPPAVGLKIINGPIVPSPGDTADFNGTPMPGFKNLRMTSFQKYINGTDPADFSESYNYMRGLNRDGSPQPNGTKYAVPGDPVTGVGDLDSNPSDRRMLGTCGPLTLVPGDSQYIFVEIAVGQGSDYLTSITAVKGKLTNPLPQFPILATAMEPDPINIMMLNALDPIQAELTFGYDASAARGEDFDYGTLAMTDLPPIDSMVIAADHPEFNGEVVRFYFPLADLLLPYQPLLDSAVHAYSVTGQHIGGAPFSFPAEIVIYGHQSGDLNLDGQVDISDLVFMVDFFFMGGPAPDLLETADLDQNGTVDISDMLVLIELMFGQ